MKKYHKYKKKITIFLSILLILIIYNILTFEVAASVRVEPARIIINTLEQKNNTGLIEVINNGEEKIELTAFLNDWSLDERDSVIFFEAGYTDYSLDGLIKFNPRIFAVQPGKKQIVRFTISDPEALEIPKERRGVVFFEHETGQIDEATGSRIKAQIGTVIYFIPENVKYNFKFLGLRIFKNDVGLPQGVVIKIANNGEAHIRYYPFYRIVDSQNNVVMEKEISELLVLPNNEREFAFYLEERLEPGNYKFMLEFNLHNINRQVEYQIPITID